MIRDSKSKNKSKRQSKHESTQKPQRKRAGAIVYTPPYWSTSNICFHHFDSDPPVLERVDLIDIDQINGDILSRDVTFFAN